MQLRRCQRLRRGGGWRGAGSANSKGQSAASTERNFHNIPQRSHSIKVAGIYRAAVSNGIVGSHCAALAARHSASARHAAAARLDLPPLASMPIQTRRCVLLYMYIHIHVHIHAVSGALTFRRHAREVPPRAPFLLLSLSLSLSLFAVPRGVPMRALSEFPDSPQERSFRSLAAAAAVMDPYRTGNDKARSRTRRGTSRGIRRSREEGFSSLKGATRPCTRDPRVPLSSSRSEIIKGETFPRSSAGGLACSQLTGRGGFVYSSRRLNVARRRDCPRSRPFFSPPVPRPSHHSRPPPAAAFASHRVPRRILPDYN